MNWNLFWGFYTLAFAAACWGCAYFLVYRERRKARRCTAHTVGRVAGWSHLHCAGLPLPLVVYEAGGRSYRVAGPRFTGGVLTTVSLPTIRGTELESNLTTREALPMKLRVKLRRNSFGSALDAYSSPLSRLYPPGSPADVFYDPARPRDAFVQRFAGLPRALEVFICASAAALTALSAVFFWGPRIVMH